MACRRPLEGRSLLDGYPLGLFVVMAAAVPPLLWRPLGVLSAIVVVAAIVAGARNATLPLRGVTLALAGLGSAAFGGGLGLLLHGPTDDLDSAAYGGMLWYVAKVVSAAESIVPFRDPLVEGEKIIYTEAGTSFVGTVLSWLPGFDPILYHAATLPTFAAASLCIGLALFVNGRPVVPPLVGIAACAARCRDRRLPLVDHRDAAGGVRAAARLLAVARLARRAQHALARAVERGRRPRLLPDEGDRDHGPRAAAPRRARRATQAPPGLSAGRPDRRRPARARRGRGDRASVRLCELVRGARQAEDAAAGRVRGLTDGDPDVRSLGLVCLVVGEVCCSPRLPRSVLGALRRVRRVRAAVVVSVRVRVRGRARQRGVPRRAAAPRRRAARPAAGAGRGGPARVRGRCERAARPQTGFVLVVALLVALGAVAVRSPAVVRVCAVAAAAAAALVLAVNGGLDDPAVAITTADHDIWAEVEQRVPEDGLVFTSLTGREVTPHEGWNNYPAVAERQLFIAGWYDGRLVSHEADRDRKLAENRSVLTGRTRPGDARAVARVPLVLRGRPRQRASAAVVQARVRERRVRALRDPVERERLRDHPLDVELRGDRVRASSATRRASLGVVEAPRDRARRAPADRRPGRESRSRPRPRSRGSRRRASRRPARPPPAPRSPRGRGLRSATGRRTPRTTRAGRARRAARRGARSGRRAAPRAPRAPRGARRRRRRRSARPDDARARAAPPRPGRDGPSARRAARRCRRFGLRARGVRSRSGRGRSRAARRACAAVGRRTRDPSRRCRSTSGRVSQPRRCQARPAGLSPPWELRRVVRDEQAAHSARAARRRAPAERRPSRGRSPGAAGAARAEVAASVPAHRGRRSPPAAPSSANGASTGSSG